MRQTARIISTYSADTFGVCSALFELGGMVIMHDASGCNSTYTTHDEPRWYDMDSMIYISGLSEMEAIMGDDEKLINDIVEAAEAYHPAFIAIAGTPIPTMTGFDYEAVAELIEDRTGIPAFGFSTTGMNTYVHGASMAFAGIAKRFVRKDVEKTKHLSANILGVTPLDFSVNGSSEAMESFLRDAGFEVISNWAMGSSLEELASAGRATVNLVVSESGIEAAQVLQRMFGTPYVVGTPVGNAYQSVLTKALLDAASEGHYEIAVSDIDHKEIAVIGEGITALSLAQAIELEYKKGVKVLCATECESKSLRPSDRMTPDEEDVIEALNGVKIVIADPLYKPICPKDCEFVELPSESFSGRLYRDRIPNLINGFKK